MIAKHLFPPMHHRSSPPAPGSPAHILSSPDTHAAPNTPVTAPWPDTSALSPLPFRCAETKTAPEGEAHPQPPALRVCSPGAAVSTALGSRLLQFALKEDFWPVITLARSGVIRCWTRALKTKPERKEIEWGEAGERGHRDTGQFEAL